MTKKTRSPWRRLPDAETLRRLYWDEKLSQQAIADKYDVTRAAVALAMKKAGIPARAPREAHINNRTWTLPSTEELRRLYHDERLTASEIGRRYGVGGHSIIKVLRDEHGIEMRPHGRRMPSNEELLRLYWEEEMSFAMIGEMCNISPQSIYSTFNHYGLKTRTREEARALATRLHRNRYKLPSDEELKRLYWEEEKSGSDIAEMYECSYGSVHALFKRRGIKMRNIAEANKVSHSKRYSHKPALPDADTLRDLYWNQELSLFEIAQMYDRHQSSILQRCQKLGIPRRSKSEAQRLRRQREVAEQEGNP